MFSLPWKSMVSSQQLTCHSFQKVEVLFLQKKLITVNKRTRSKPHRLKFFTETKNKNSMCDAYTIWINFIVALKIRRVTTPLRFIFFALRRQGTTPLGCISGCTSNKESFGSFRVYLLLHLRSEESQPLQSLSLFALWKTMQDPFRVYLLLHLR